MRRDAPLPSITADILAITQSAQEMSAAERERAAAQVDLHQAYHRLFFREGKLTADGRTVLLDLSREAAIGAASPTIDHAELAVKEGKRRLFLYLTSRFQLSGERLSQLERQLIQEED